MSKYSTLAVAAVLITSTCLWNSCKNASSRERSASETLVAYYDAVEKGDSAATFALCSDARLKNLKTFSANYFASAAKYVSTIHVLSERKTSDSEATVQYTDVVKLRATGEQVDSSLVECDMKKEHGEWKVVQCHAPYQPITPDMTFHDLNLSFDSAGDRTKPADRMTPADRMKPADWYAGGGGRSSEDMNDYNAELDGKNVHDGKYSLHLSYVNGEGFGVATSYLGGLLPQVTGKTIRLGGWIKTKDVGEYAGLWWRVDGKDGRMLAFNNMQDSAIKGTQDWKHYSFELPVGATAANVNFGVLMAGKGEAWFDGLTIDTNGKPWKR